MDDRTTTAPADEPRAINALVVLGPTASGKTRLGVRLARRFGGEVVSADSRQVYRGLDIGSGKDLEEYLLDGVRIPCHLVDVVDLAEAEFSVFEFQRRFFDLFVELRARHRLPVVVGGTGLYLEAALSRQRMLEVPRDEALRDRLALLDEQQLAARLRRLRPRLHNVTDLRDRQRLVRAIEIATFEARDDVAATARPAPEVRPLVLGTRWDRQQLRERIRERLEQRLRGGLIEEVEGLLARGVGWDRLYLLGLEYRFVARYLRGEIRNRNDLKQQLHAAICNFAKRQATWFRRMERNGGARIHWIDRADPGQAEALVSRHLEPAV